MSQCWYFDLWTGTCWPNVVKQVCAAIVLSSATTGAAVAATWTGTVIHGFTGAGHGNSPIYGTLVQDGSGALYGTASGQGSGEREANGLIFRLTPTSRNGHKWTFSPIFKFPHPHGTDPGYPIGGLTIDAQGNLYGTTTVGVVFELSPPTSGGKLWTFTTIANLESQVNNTLVGSLLLSSSGTLFGVSISSASHGNGSVFELIPPGSGNGPWSYNLIYAFKGDPDGSLPSAGLISDPEGNLYGTTTNGGRSDVGTAFELVAPSGGQSSWTETVLHSFKGGSADGSNPLCSLMFDSTGALYGTTYAGGKSQAGTIFKLNPPVNRDSKWSEDLLHDFDGPSAVGPKGGLIFDVKGDLYGTTETGPGAAGTVYKLSPPVGPATKWSFRTLWNFPQSGTLGQFPEGNLLVTALGDLYGTTEYGGPGPCSGVVSCGTVFRVAP